MATNAPQDDWHKTGLRLPRDLHALLHEAAAASGRSYNAEIVARLQGSFAASPEQPSLHQSALAALADQLSQLQDQRNALAVLKHAMTATGTANSELARVADEIQGIDAAIESVLTKMHAPNR